MLTGSFSPENLDWIKSRSILAEFPAFVQFKMADSTECVEGSELVEGQYVFSVLLWYFAFIPHIYP